MYRMCSVYREKLKIGLCGGPRVQLEILVMRWGAQAALAEGAHIFAYLCPISYTSNVPPMFPLVPCGHPAKPKLCSPNPTHGSEKRLSPLTSPNTWITQGLVEAWVSCGPPIETQAPLTKPDTRTALSLPNLQLYSPDT